MPRRTPGLLLEDILAAIEKIERYVGGLDMNAFLGDDKTSDAFRLPIIDRQSKIINGEIPHAPGPTHRGRNPRLTLNAPVL